MTEHLRLPRGVYDLGPADAEHVYEAERRWFEATSAFGFRPVRFPPIGFEATFLRGHGIAPSRVYAFADRKGRRLALAADSLAQVVRHVSGSTDEQRLAFSSPVFRCEHRPRRYFHHLGAAHFVPAEADARGDARILSRLLAMLSAFIGTRAALEVSLADFGIWRTIGRAIGGLDLRAFAMVDRVDRAAWLQARSAPRFAVELAERLACEPTNGLALVEAAWVRGVLPDDLRARFDALLDLGRAFADGPSRSAVVALDQLHASEFHDGFAFCVRLAGRGGRPIGDGGSYRAYAEQFGGRSASIFSVAVGLEKLVSLLPRARRSAADVLIRALDGEPESALATALAGELRAAGLRVWEAERRGRVRRDLEDADRLGISCLLIVGPEEVRAGRFTLRTGAGDLVSLPREALAGAIAGAPARVGTEAFALVGADDEPVEETTR